MTLTIEVPEELGADLTAEAQKLGLPVADYAARILAIGLVPVDPKPTSGAELVEYWRREGLIGTRPDITDSQAHARAIRARVENARAEAREVE